MSDRLTVILPPVLSAEEREQAALKLCGGSLAEGNGWGYGDGYGDGWGDGWGYGNGWGYGDGCGWGYGSSDGDGRSKTHV